MKGNLIHSFIYSFPKYIYQVLSVRHCLCAWESTINKMVKSLTSQSLHPSEERWAINNNIINKQNIQYVRNYKHWEKNEQTRGDWRHGI